ncbi:MAG: hypothetical protein JWR44_2498 [Hymenobacter sp.]|jgi:hypothetical protein|nr:hypothetical protein [Hymenobacter sp.]
MKHSLRVYLLASFCGLAAVPARAQTTPPPVPPSTTPAPAVASAPAGNAMLLPPDQVKTKYKIYLNQRYVGDKEALAAIHMFGRKQTGGALWLLGGASFLGYIASQTGTKTTGSGTTTVTVSPLGYVVFTVLPAGIAIGKFSRFSNGELFKVLQEYDKNHSFPGYVTAKLGKSDYQ